MNFIFIIYTIGMVLYSPMLEANCHKVKKSHAGPQGPQGIQGLQGVIGPQGLQGIQGPTGSLVNNYVSAASDIQSIIFTGANFPINFPTNLVPPVGIVHPYLSDDSRFEILDNGIYQIAWTVPLEWDNISENMVELFLYDAASATYFLPSPISKGEFDHIPGSTTTSRYMTLSGQTILSLQAGTIVQLLIHATSVITGVKYARFTITKIAN